MKELRSDILIIQGVKKNDAICQRELVDKYSNVLFATALRYMGNQDEAKDVLQDTFIKIFRACNNFDAKKGNLKSWMQKICINTALKALKKNRNHASLYEIHNAPGIRSGIESKLDVDDMFEIIKGLPEKYRTVFNLHVVEGYPHKEIAEMLNIEIGSSRSILSRAKESLRNKIMTIKNREAWI